jgi:DNA replication and repair protein RecF
MMISHLSLTNFRNYARLELDLPAGITLLQGDNAQGKTNLLESIYYLATSRSPQAGADWEVINWLVRNDPLAFARLVADVRWNGGAQRIELTLVPSPGARSNSPVFRKQIRINGVSKRAMDLIGLVNVVIFRPQDIELVSDAPGNRRRYLDAMLCQLDSRYCRALQLYNQVLNQRNCLLRQLRERGGGADQMVFWDQRLAEHGAYITTRRQEALERLDQFSQPIHLDMTDQKERLSLHYQPSLPLAVSQQADSGRPGTPATGEWKAEDAAITELAHEFRAGLQKMHHEELARGATLLGPHRDDFRFLLADGDLTVYGSRGQQRTAALALKLAETELVRQIKGHWPILLLDDVMSELDGARRTRLMELVNGATQTLMTTTDIDAYSVGFLSHVTRYQVREGRLERLVS